MAQKTELVGILNITPDSFSDGGRYQAAEDAITQADALFAEGAALVDVGAESTRPGATPLTSDEEWARLEPVLTQLVSSYPNSISLDTYHPETAQRAAQLGTIVLNDVTAFHNPHMREVAAQFGVRCIVSHLPESVGQDIQQAHREKQVESVQQVYEELLTRRDELTTAGVQPENIILDPGIGFGKTATLNWQLLSFASLVPEHDVMVGYSRKRFLGKDRMGIKANLAAGKVAITAGTKYLRVHDVAAHYSLLGAVGQL